VSKKKKIKFFVYSGFWKRLLAVLIDGLVLSPVIIVTFKFNRYFMENRMILPIIVENLITYSYSILLPSFYGGTLGKLALKIRIVDVNGHNISISKSALRSSPYIINWLLFIVTKFVLSEGVIANNLNTIYGILSNFMLIDGLFLIFSPQKRAIHDYIAGTYVVNSKK